MTKKLYWHFLPEDRKLRYGTREIVEVGKTITVDCEPVLCKQGLHASERALDALKYAPGPIVCLVWLGGKIVVGDDKVAAQNRTVLAMADASRVLHEFACDVAEASLKTANITDPRCQAAIDAKRKWLQGEITNQQLAAAWAAAWEAQNIQLEKRLRQLLDANEAATERWCVMGDVLQDAWDRMQEHTDGHNWYWLSYGEKCYAFAVVTAFPWNDGDQPPPSGERLDLHPTNDRLWITEDGTAMMVDKHIANIERQNGDVICRFIAMAYANAQKRYEGGGK